MGKGSWWRCAWLASGTVTFAAVLACGSESGEGGAPPSDAGSETAYRVIDAGVSTDATIPDSGSSDAMTGSDVYPAPHVAPPEVLTYGGPVLTAPKIIPIFFANDPMKTQVEQFLTALAASAYWTKVTEEYGGGPLSIGASIVVDDALPTMLTDPQIGAWLGAYLDGTHPTWPAIDGNNIYMVFYQDSATISYGTPTRTSCVDFGGYHSSTVRPALDAGAPLEGDAGVDGSATPDAASPDAASADAGGAPDGGVGFDAAGATDDGPGAFVYSVIPRCPGFNLLQGFDEVSFVVSHETVEATTDPFPQSNPAYATVDEDHVIWDFLPLAEVGDMCAYEGQAAQRLVGDFMVQRIWSNIAAAAGIDPCTPELPSSVYYNAAPDLTDSVKITSDGHQYPTLGVRVPVGQSKTVNVRFFSTGPTEDWTVTFNDSSTLYGGTPLLSFSPSSVSGNNGDVVAVEVTAVRAGPSGGSEWVLSSYREGDGAYEGYWFGFVEN